MSQMTEKDILKLPRRMSYNDDFYSNVFKRTEQIVSATFYVLSYIGTDQPAHKVHTDALTATVRRVHEEALRSLEMSEADIAEKIHALQHSLVVLESTLRVAVAGRAIGGDVVMMILREIDGVMRFIKNHYAKPDTLPTLLSSSVPERRPPAPRPRRERVVIPKGDLSSEAILVHSQLSDRTTRIKTVLEAKPGATIKDLTDIITDVSSKTIQRDLNDLIGQGQVVRTGERRWSRYTLVQSGS